MTPAHARLAMALLDVDRVTLAEEIGVDKQTVSAFLRDTRSVGHRTLDAMQAYFVRNGVVFLYDDDEGGIGVRFK